MKKFETLDRKTKSSVMNAQKNELTGYYIYKKLAERTKDAHNRKILTHISKDELKHHNFWKSLTKRDVGPNRLIIWFYYLLSKFFGLTFGIKLMERGEGFDQLRYKKLSKVIPETKAVLKDEHEHEKELIALLEEEKLKYVGSIVLGLNDALVELTGAIAGLTFAFQNTGIVGVAGLVTGIAASFSMSASEYLSTKTEGHQKSPIKASVYTGLAYITTVLFLVIPYFIFKNYYFALGLTLMNALVIILMFTFYISVANDLSFKKRFLEMVLISFGVATFSFLIGLVVRIFLGIDV